MRNELHKSNDFVFKIEANQANLCDASDTLSMTDSRTPHRHSEQSAAKPPIALGVIQSESEESPNKTQTTKTLIKTALIVSLLFIPAMTYAQGADPDTTTLSTPTLDALAGKPIPDTDPQEYYPADMKSGYTLTEIPNADPNNLPANTITKYEIKETIKYYDPATGAEVLQPNLDPNITYKEVQVKEIIPHYYTVALKQTEYGTPNAENAVGHYYKWQTTDGKTTLVPGTASDHTLTYYEDPTKTAADRITANQNGADINSNFIGQNVTSSAIEGGAIYNTGTIGKITGDFIDNYVSSPRYAAQGGAIYNNGTIEEIIGNFINNYAKNGGAISNDAVIGNINGNFIGNYVYSGGGGAVYNTGTIGNITGDFVGNYLTSASSAVKGGAIYSYGGIIGDITGDFIGNYAYSSSSAATGGAIYNFAAAKIGNITGDFVGNYASSSSSTASRYDSTEGGAIYNNGTVGNITGDFMGNYASGSNSKGGAIYNNGGTIGDITGDFIGNYSSSPFSSQGGAISNSGYGAQIGNITGDFIGNYASSSSSYSSSGGAINSRGTVGNITGDFIGNYASSSDVASGGAIENSFGTIGNITGDFIGNYAFSSFTSSEASAGRSSIAQGGAINNKGTIADITGNFVGNYVYAHFSSPPAPFTYCKANGGAISNEGPATKIGNITGDFVGNYIFSTSSLGPYRGGAISNSGTIENIKGDFIYNYISASASSAYGGAIENGGTIGNITGNFINNYIVSKNASGGAIYNGLIGVIGDITGDFIGNYASSSYSSSGGAINSRGTVGNITGDFVGNYARVTSTTADYANAKGGAIYNKRGKIGYDADGNKIGGIINSSFINNYVKAEGVNVSAKGGAIYNEDANLDIIARDNGTSLFRGNYAEINGNKKSNAIYMTKFVYKSDAENPSYTFSPDTLTLKAETDGTIRFDDKISGGAYYTDSSNEVYLEDSKYAYNLNITGDTTGKVIFNNEVKNANISVENTNVYVTDAKYIAPNPTLAVNSGVLNVNNLGVDGLHYDTFANDGTINLTNVNVDLQNEKMGTITANTYGSQTGTVNVQSLLLLNDAAKDKTNIFFAPSEYAANVSYTGISPIAYSPIYKYNVSYAQNPEDNQGYFTFVRGAAGSTNPSDSYNPSVLPTPVTQQTGAYTTQLQTFHYAFQHADNFMNIPYLERLAIKNGNKYALSPTGDATDVGVFSPLFTKDANAGFWFKPYSSFENIPLKNGPKVSNINYGTLIGYDSELTPIAKGFDRVLTGYLGYNGASQRYQGVDSYQNGGIMGGTMTLYKGNFFNATTISVGASQGTNTGMYGTENYTMLLAGIGEKFGYNFEFNKGKIILQPSMLMSYTFVNTFDYKNAAGVRISADPLNALQLSPGIKLIGNLKNGWQPYLAVNMIWNILDDTKVQANEVRLPSMSIDPYVEYGVGVQKRWSKRYTAYAQAMIRNGGRNGVSLTCGFRWAVGKK